MSIRWKGNTSWELHSLSTATGRARRSGGGGVSLPSEFLARNVRVEREFEVVSRTAAAKRSGPPQSIDLEIDLKPGEAAVLALRHSSGALTFHAPAEGGSRRAARSTGTSVARFAVAIPQPTTPVEARRGVLSAGVRAIVLKVAKVALKGAAGWALTRLAAEWERRLWSQRGLSEGWFRLRPRPAGSGFELLPGSPTGRERALLFLHGTFSNANSAFAPLASPEFIAKLRPAYGDRIYAFNHYTVSRTPEENARTLLDGLGDIAPEFDVVTHSRGGLVLRNLVERRDALGPAARRFQARRVVLVASPNGGTPLVTPSRWEAMVSWIANLSEIFPDSPFSAGAAFVSEAIIWLAHGIAERLPGLHSMDADDQLVAQLQGPPGPPPDCYSALVTNFHPDSSLLRRMADVGVDQFFGGANDLVVPTEGGWRIDAAGNAFIPGSRVGCFGPGGNLAPGEPGSVHHLNFFERPETQAFIANALSGKPQDLAVIDVSAELPDRRVVRGGAAEPRALPAAAQPAMPVAAIEAPGRDYTEADGTFQLVVLQDDLAQIVKDEKSVRLLATYAGARVLDSVVLERAGRQTSEWRRICGLHDRIKAYTDLLRGSLPADGEMLDLGVSLFGVLFPPKLRRLYDEARARQRGRLDFVLTSMSPDFADKPWEFAFDETRRSFLATEEMHFVRNVLTTVPADLTASGEVLRILVASAQPIGMGALSIDQETEVIRRGFEPLIESGRALVHVLPRATPPAIHGLLSTGRFNVFHFIGHGEFDEQRREGCLIFEDVRGGRYPLYERSVRELLCKRGLSLAFLNACQTGTSSSADFNKGVAQSLVEHGLPALVANQYSVSDSSATSFAQHFYWSLAHGLSVGQAAREARIAVNYSLHGDSIDWAVPVVYARDPGMTLCPSRPAQATIPSTIVKSASRRAIAGHQQRIAVWDMDHFFPKIEQTLRRLNAAQKTFGFELVDLSAPLDVWRRRGGIPYLHAVRLADRLRTRPVELHVDLVVCITQHWLQDDAGEDDLLAWWPDDHDPRVTVLSFAGLDGLEAEGQRTDRALTNSLVGVMAGFWTAFEGHNRLPRTCPLYYNVERDFQWIVGESAFDPKCRRGIAKKMKGAQDLEVLLRVFDDLPRTEPRNNKKPGRRV